MERPLKTAATPPPTDADDRLLTAEEAAKIIRYKPRTLTRWRTDGTGRGPVFVRVGAYGRPRYRYSDLMRWMAEL